MCSKGMSKGTKKVIAEPVHSFMPSFCSPFESIVRFNRNKLSMYRFPGKLRVNRKINLLEGIP